MMAEDTIKNIPQGKLAEFIGWLGRNAETVGRGSHDALKTLAKTDPIKSGLAQALLTEPLMRAGAAAQDWTGTPRDATPETPYRGDIIGSLRGDAKPLLDPRLMDVAMFGQPAASVARRAASTVRDLPAVVRDAAMEAYSPVLSHVAPKKSTQLVDLSTLPTADAIAIARKEPHLIKSGDQSEGLYVGGPRDVKSKRALTNMRKENDAYIAEDPHDGNGGCAKTRGLDGKAARAVVCRCRSGFRTAICAEGKQWVAHGHAGEVGSPSAA